MRRLKSVEPLLLELLALLGAEMGLEHPAGSRPLRAAPRSSIRSSRPLTRKIGGSPAISSRSLAFCWIISVEEAVERLPFRHLGLGEGAKRQGAGGFGGFGSESEVRLAGRSSARFSERTSWSSSGSRS